MDIQHSPINIAIPLTYDMFFDDKPKGIIEYLTGINRYKLVKLALCIINSYKLLRQFNKFLGFVCSEDNRNFCETLMVRYLNYSNDSEYPSYYAVSERTGLNLLRYSFSLPILTTQESANTILEDQNIVKAILLINKENIECNVEESCELDYDEKLAAGLFCEQWNMFTGAFEKHSELSIISQFIRGVYFFKYCDNSLSFNPILRDFLEIKGYATWGDYLCDMMKLSLFPLKLENNVYCTFSRISLDSSNPDYSKRVVMFRKLSSKISDVIQLSDNDDCKIFRGKPLIQVSETEFWCINSQFCINQLFESLFFQFKELAEIKGYDVDVFREYTTNFAEKTLFYDMVRRLFNGRACMKLSGDEMSKSHPEVKGEPDYYVRNGNKIFLFENKDIRIAADIRGCKSYNSVKSVIFKKLVSKPNHRNSKVGVTQIISNIERIIKGSFIWDKGVNNPKIYPILVVNDPVFSLPGINFIINKEFQTLLRKLDIPCNIKIHPIILINMDVLIHYSGYFNAKKLLFENVLNGFIRNITAPVQSLRPQKVIDNILKSYFSFSTYMITEYHPVRGNDQIDNMLNELHEMVYGEAILIPDES